MTTQMDRLTLSSSETMDVDIMDWLKTEMGTAAYRKQNNIDGPQPSHLLVIAYQSLVQV